MVASTLNLVCGLCLLMTMKNVKGDAHINTHVSHRMKAL
jgi:hypothetical protein